MKVDGIVPSSIVKVKTSHRVENPHTNTKLPSLGTDEVAVSNKAQSFQTLLLKAKELPAVREVKVRELSEQLAKGQFQFDSARLAKLLLDGPIQ